MSDTYDVIVIGAGPAGEVAAQRAREGGLSVAIVEGHLVGGECSYFACIPTKTVLRPIHAVRAAQRLQGVTGAALDVADVLARRETWVSGRDDAGQADWLASVDIELVRGHARITAARQVTVDDRVLTARQAVIVATGTRAAIPDLPGLRESKPWTNVEATATDTVPPRLLVLGGGVVACELAQTFAALGSTVIMVERGGRLLGRLDDIAADAVLDALRSDGVDVRLGVSASSVERDGTGVAVTLDDGSTIAGDEVLCALGRTPNTDELGLAELGVDLDDRGHLAVDDQFGATGVGGPWLYGVGDVTGRVGLTHMGKYQARACGDLVVARAAGEVDPAELERYGRLNAAAVESATPQVIFTDPEVASVGPTFAEAKESGRNVRAVEVSMASATGASLQADGYTGTARLLVDTDTETVIGATFVGQDTAELVHAATVAIVGEVPLAKLWHAVPSFPTMSEIWLRLLEEYGL